MSSKHSYHVSRSMGVATAFALAHLTLNTAAIAQGSGGVSAASPTTIARSAGEVEVRVLDDLVDRSGPVATIGVVSRAASEAKLAGSALICTAKGLTEQGDDGESRGPWLFAAPLGQDESSDSIKPGVNAFRLTVQGYDLGRSENPVAERHVAYVFTMLRNRTLDLAVNIKDETKSSEFRSQGLAFAGALANAARFDVSSQFGSLRSLDEFVECSVRVKVLHSDGQVRSTSVKISVLGVIFWLSNYIRAEHAAMVLDFETAIARLGR